MLRQHVRQRASLGTFLLLSFLGCGTDTGPAVAPSSPIDSPSPLSETEVKEFAVSLESAAGGASLVSFESMFDFNAMFEIAITGLNATEDLKQRFRRGFDAGLDKGGLVNEVYNNATVNGGSYKFLRLHRQDDEDRALFRSLSAKGGIDYHDVIVRRRYDGRIKAVDVYDFAIGEKISETVRRVMIWVIAKQDHSLVGRLKGPDHALLEHADKLDRLANAAQTGDPQDGLRAFDELPNDLRKNKNFLLLRFSAARRSGDEVAWLKAVEDLRREFPNDACMDLFAIDYYSLKRRFSQAQSAIDRVEKAVESDPYLDVLRGNTFLAEENLAKARMHFEQAARHEPALLGAHWGLIAVGLRQKAFDDVLNRLKTIDKLFKPQFAELAEQPLYAEFVKSPQYQEWLNYLKGR